MYETGNHDKEGNQGKGEDEEDDLSYLDRPMITYSQRTIPVQNLHLATRAVEEHEQNRVKDFHLDIQLDQCSQAIDRFTEIDGLGVQINLLHLGIGTHHEIGLLRKREHSIQ